MRAFGIGFLVVALCATTVVAEPVTFNWSGTVRSVADVSVFPQAAAVAALGVVAGADARGSFTIETDTVVTPASPPSLPVYFNAILAMEMTIGGFTLSGTPGGIFNLMAARFGADTTAGFASELDPLFSAVETPSLGIAGPAAFVNMVHRTFAASTSQSLDEIFAGGADGWEGTAGMTRIGGGPVILVDLNRFGPPHPVPEPSTIVFVAVAAGLLGWRRRTALRDPSDSHRLRP